MKRRSAGLTVFDLLQRKKNLRVAAVLLAGLFDSDDSSGSGSDSGEEEADDDHVAKDDISEIVSYVFVKKVVTIDKPLRINMQIIFHIFVITVRLMGKNFAFHRLTCYRSREIK